MMPSGRLLILRPLPVFAAKHGLALGGVAVDSRGVAFVTDQTGDRVLRFSAQGRPLPTWTHPGLVGFASPAGIAVREKGHQESIYVADTLHDRIVKLSTSGTALGSWPTYDVSGYYDPISVAVDDRGYMYIADANVGA